MTTAANRSLSHRIRSALRVVAVVITVGLSVVALLPSPFGASDEEVPRWLLALAGAIVGYIVIEFTVTLNTIAATLRQVADRQIGSVRATDFFTDPIPDPLVADRIREAQTLSISGINLASTTKVLASVLEEVISRNGTVRAVLMDPEANDACSASAYRFRRHQDPMIVTSDVRTGIRNFSSLRYITNKKHAVAVRLIPVQPPYGIWIVDADKPTAEIFVEIYSFRSSTEPTFRILPNEEPWFSFFADQFETMWKHGRDWSKDEQESGKLPTDAE